MRDVRFFRHVPLWNIPVWFRYQPRRVHCSRCGGVRTEQLPWVTGKQRLTRAYSCFLAKWAEMLPWHSVARLFGCAWGTVATAVKSMVKYGMEHRDLSGITHIGIDGISRKKGQVYLTNVYDLRSKTLIWSGVERTRGTLRSFFNSLGPERAGRLQGICCDMWQPCVEVIRECAPQASLVFDKWVPRCFMWVGQKRGPHPGGRSWRSDSSWTGSHAPETWLPGSGCSCLPECRC